MLSQGLVAHVITDRGTNHGVYIVRGAGSSRNY